MYNFALQFFFIISLGIIIYLLARALPRVKVDEPQPRLLDFFDKAAKRLPIARLDNILGAYLEKTLRKARVIILKLDNYINARLNKKNGNSNSEQIDFKKIKSDYK